jgi:2-polyprenyl-3-methyl-5-hydroxy-6-metoxy-1,4-benzoquinol methylase
MAGHKTPHTDGRILFAPAIGKGTGTGHIKRCAELVRRAGGRAGLLLAPGHGLPDSILKPVGRKHVIERLAPDSRFKLIVTDQKQTPFTVLSEFAARAPVIGLDEGGRFRDCFPYLIDTLPGPRSRCAPNRVLPFWPRGDFAHRKAFSYPFRRALLSFGGEDRQGLTRVLLEALLKHGVYAAADVSVVQGPLFQHTHWPLGVRVYTGVDDLTPLFTEHDLLLTHFGLTCYEAMACGMPFIVFNPSSYHGTLTREAGFPEIGVGRPRIRRLRRLLEDAEPFRRLLARGAPPARTTFYSLPELLLSGSLSGPYACPLCNRRPGRSLARFEDKTFFWCSRCGMIHALHFGTDDKKYEREYFFSGYRRQYGRTYLEDFDYIRKNGEVRLEIILKLLGRGRNTQPPRAGGNAQPPRAAQKAQPPRAGGNAPSLPAGGNARLLDIGCAYGPFLKAAASCGMRTQGMDISAAAVRYVTRTLGMPCMRMDFRNPSPGFLKKHKNAFDVVSLWYVLEHFQNPGRVLKNINLLLKPGGVLAFSTPSAEGISAKKNLRLFLQAGPADHFTVWSPRRVKKQLAVYGFTVKKIKITGHHAERFFRPRPAAAGMGRWRRRLFTAISRLLGLGDTFEAYAVKTGDAT